MLSLTALLISLMYSIDLERRSVIVLGMAFLSSVFIAYFLIGLGLLETFSILSVLLLPPHLISRVSAAIMLFVGGANVINYFVPELIPIYNIFMSFRTRAVRFIRTLTIPSMIIAGLLTGIHNFPCACTGGIYFTFLSAIVRSQFRIIYLLTYDLLFLVPSLTILMLSTNKKIVRDIRNRLYRGHGKLKLFIGLAMIFVSLIIVTLTLY